MAKKLDSFPSAQRRSKYPWHEWLDGGTWALRHGEDYKTGSESMRATTVKAAQAAGKSVRTQISKDDDGVEVLIVQAFSDESAPGSA